MKLFVSFVIVFFVIGACALALAFDAGKAPSLDAGTKAAPSLPAAPAAPVDATKQATEDPVGAAVSLVKALRNHDWKIAAGFALALLLSLGAKMRDKVAFLKGDRGGVIAVFVLAFGGALATAWVAESPLDLKLATTAASIGLMAIGGYTGLKRLIWPKDQATED